MTNGTKISARRRGVLLMSSAAIIFNFGAGAAVGRDAAEKQRLVQVANTGDTRPETRKLVEQANQALAQNHPDVAAIFLRKALAAEPENSDLRVQLGNALLRAGDTTNAERELRLAREKGATDDGVLPILFEVMLARSENSQLLAQFSAPAEGDTSALASYILRARATALIATGKSSDAAASLDRALSFDRSVVNLVARAQVAALMGETALGLKSIDDALSKSPKEEKAKFLKIELLLQDKQQVQALDGANQLVNDYPNTAPALITRARVYLQANENKKALADLDASLKIVPRSPLALFYKAAVIAQANDLRLAWDLVQGLPPEFVNLRPEIGMAVSEIAIKAGHAEIGTSMLASVVSKFPNDVNARVRLVSRYVELKDTTRALQTLQPVSNSSDPRIILLLAQLYEMQQQYSTAAQYAQKLIDEGVGGDALKRQTALMNMQAGQVEAAIGQLEKLNTANPGDQLVAGPLINALMTKNDFAKARELADKLAAAAPSQPYGAYFQGQLSLRQGDLDKAISSFSRAIELDPKYVPPLYDRATAYGARGDLMLAEADLRSLLTIDPKNIMAEINLAQMALRRGNTADAEIAMKKAAAAHPNVVLPMLVLTSFYIQQGRINDAIALVKDFLERFPDNLEALTMRGEIMLVSGKTDEAVSVFTELARRDSKTVQNQLLLATALTKAGRAQDAAQAYQRALELAPATHAAHIGLISLSLANKDEGAAIAAARNYAEKQPSPLSVETLAGTYLTLKKLKDAEDVLLQAQEKYPNSATLISLTRLLRSTNQAKRADDLLSAWVDKHPDDINARLAYGSGQLQSDPVTAEIQFRAVLQAQPYNLTGLNNLAWLLQSKNPEDAVLYAERALKIAPGSPAVLDTLGWAKWLANDKGTALKLLEQAHAADASSQDISYHLVVALDGNGRREEAKKLLSELLASNRPFQERKEAEALKEKWQ